MMIKMEKEKSEKLNDLVQKLVKTKLTSFKNFSKIKQKLSSEFKISLPANNDILEIYYDLKRKNKIKESYFLEHDLKKRPIRSLSGVAVVAVLTKPWPCPGKCFYCPLEKGVPKSYLSGEPAVERAKILKYNPYFQTKSRIQILERNGHPTDKIELIVIGGTWSYLPKQYQSWFIKRCFDGANKSISKNLAQAQKKNEKAKNRIVGLTLETRPDYLDLNEIKRMRDLGATRVEIGVQSLDNKILKKNRRGHGTKETIRATRLLKNAGFKICYHLMPGLAGSTLKKDFEMFQDLFSNSDFQPDMLKIYPCVVAKGSPLYQSWKKGQYRPYSSQQLIELIIKIKLIIPPYVRINRLIRDIPAYQIQAGSKISNLREIIQKIMKEKNIFCQCIRCREVKGQKINLKDFKLKENRYSASNGQEIFLSFENKEKNKLAAFLRLRLPDLEEKEILPVLQNAALIRELHTYGQLVEIKNKKLKATQHFGFGKKLIERAEQIAKNQGFQKIAVISGIGVREYYRHLGYRLKKTYLVKKI